MTMMFYFMVIIVSNSSCMCDALLLFFYALDVVLVNIILEFIIELRVKVSWSGHEW